MKEYISQLKAYDFYAEFKVGYYLDAYDEHKWKVAQIKDINKYGLRTTIVVRFDGYSTKCDSSYDLPSSHKLAPFRTHTLPYTGPSGIEPKREEPTYKYAAYFKDYAKVFENNEKNFDKIKPTFINQSLRGVLFIIADYIITKRNFQSNFEEASNFLIKYIKEGSTLMNTSIEIMKELEKEPFDASLFNVHPKIAILLANTEFLFIINSIISSKESRCEIQRNYDKWTSNQISFSKKLKILNVCDKIMDFKAANGRSLPWSLKKQACLLLSHMREGYVFPTPTDHREIIQILDYMYYLSCKGLLEHDEQQKKTLSLIISLILSGNFEGRLRGLNELKKVLDYSFGRKDYIVSQVQESALLAFLIDNRNFNPELFKRSLPLFSFCFSNKLIGKKELSQVLSLHKDKHQLDLKAFYSTLAEFPVFLDAEHIISFFKEMITTVPLNEMSVLLVKDYTLSAITKNAHFKQNYCKEGIQLGLTYYWNLIISQKPYISNDLTYKIIQAFANLLGDYYYSKQVEKYISLALKGIANRKNLQFYFKIIHQTLKLSKSTRIARNIEAIQKQVNIVDCVIDGLRSSQTISDKIWECMFQFLEEVTYISKRKFSYFQVRQFWSIKQCRPYLLKLLRKYREKSQDNKSHQKIIFKQLPLETMKEVITKIFLDPKEMEEYMTIPPELYQTVDQLIIAYNHNTRAIEYNYKHTIRIRVNQSIFGSEFYLNVINNCKQKEIVEKSIHRFIEIFMRVKESGRNIQNTKLTNWNSILQKFSRLKRNVLLSYKTLLEDIKGRMKSLNILEPDLVQLQVLNKSTGIRRSMHVPRFTSLWRFRFLIAQQFTLPQLNFEMILGRQATDFQNEQDFSMGLIAINKEGHSVSITQTKNKHPHLQTLDAFYRSFADLKGEELFQWLNREQDSRQALEILNKLPFIKIVQERIVKLTFKDTNDILDSSSMHKLSYQLRIINSQKNMGLIIGMIEKGFIPYISKILISKDNYKLPQYYSVLVNLISLFHQMVKFAKARKNYPFFNDSFLAQLLHFSNVQSQDYINYMAKCISFLKDIASSKQLLIVNNIRPAVVFESKQFEKIFQCIILRKSKQKISQNLVQFSKLTGNDQLLLQVANKLLKSEVLLQKQASCKSLFQVISLLLDKKIPSAMVQNIKSLMRLIRKADVMQESDEIQNQLWIGSLALLLKLVRGNATAQALEDLIGDRLQSYISFIINECLFNLAQPSKIRFKTSSLRSLGYQFLQQFQYGRAGSKLTAVIGQAMRMGGNWRRQDEWSITPTKQVTHKFTGLKNLAATCYINSLLQQLFFIDQFRDQLIAIDAQTIDDKENIVLQLQNIFAHLKYSESPVFTTSSLCRRFILDGQPIDPRVQTDVDEFFHSLMDKLERNLSKISKKEVISHIFGGELSNLIVGCACEHTSERIQPFLSIRLEIKDKKSLEEALREFIKGEVLEGDNAYFCERCDAKVKAVKRVCLKTLPQILIVTLKRFQFDYESMQKFKLNSYCSFPDIVNVLPFTRDGIDNDHDVDKSQYAYRLKGVVIHYGFSQAGHYTSYIQTDNQKWQYFDDQKITEFDPQQLVTQAYGGIEENPFGDDEDKKKNAYLLFYQKIKKNAPKQILDLSQAPIMKEIKQENTRTKLLNLLFEPTIENYMFKLGNNKLDPKTYLLYFHLVFLRSARKKEKLQNFYNTAEFILRNIKEISSWYLNQINQNFLYQFIFYCGHQIKYLATGLIIEALKTSQSVESGISVLGQLCSLIGKRNLSPAYRIIVQALKIKPYEKYLKEIGLADIVVATLKNPNKQSRIGKQSELRLKQGQNQFGFAICTYTERGVMDQIDLLQCIQTFKINATWQQLQSMSKRARKSRTQESLAAIMVKKYSETDIFAKICQLISSKLCNHECGYEDQHTFTFYIHLVEQYALLKDQFTPKRIQLLVGIYLKAMSESLAGYRTQLLLLLGLFKICTANYLFRDRFSDEFQEKDGKRLLKDIKGWAKDVNYSLSMLVRSGKLGYWRRPELKTMSMQALNFYLQSEDKLNYEKVLAALNAIVQKHNSFFNSSEEKYLREDSVRHMRQRYKFVRQIGLLAEIENEEKIKIVPYDDLARVDYFC